MLEQVWINLIDNAIKFSGEKGKVAIQIDENEAEVSVKIKNLLAYIEARFIRQDRLLFQSGQIEYT